MAPSPTANSDKNDSPSQNASPSTSKTAEPEGYETGRDDFAKAEGELSVTALVDDGASLRTLIRLAKTTAWPLWV